MGRACDEDPLVLATKLALCAVALAAVRRLYCIDAICRVSQQPVEEVVRRQTEGLGLRSRSEIADERYWAGAVSPEGSHHSSRFRNGICGIWGDHME